MPPSSMESEGTVKRHMNRSTMDAIINKKEDDDAGDRSVENEDEPVSAIDSASAKDGQFAADLTVSGSVASEETETKEEMDSRRERRLAMNRESARSRRKRKKVLLGSLATEVHDLRKRLKDYEKTIVPSLQKKNKDLALALRQANTIISMNFAGFNQGNRNSIGTGSINSNINYNSVGITGNNIGNTVGNTVGHNSGYATAPALASPVGQVPQQKAPVPQQNQPLQKQPQQQPQQQSIQIQPSLNNANVKTMAAPIQLTGINPAVVADTIAQLNSLLRHGQQQQQQQPQNISAVGFTLALRQQQQQLQQQQQQQQGFPQQQNQNSNFQR